MLRSGLLLSRFELVSVLGRGGMGEVWRARDLRLGRDVAIKVLPAELAREPDRVARFEREARALAALNHPNVAQIYELGETVPDPGPGGAAFDVPRVPVRFLVMELVEGESLSHRLRGGALPLSDALRVAGQIARGLAAAHARGVIHRDLKPGNVMLSPGGEAKVLDFGLARFRPGRRPPEDVDVTARHGEPGSVVGTAAYMSPEQVRGEECDESCDAWGFGCCLAEMLTGARAFNGPTVPEIMGKVLDGRADLERLPLETPQEVRELLAACSFGQPVAAAGARAGGRGPRFHGGERGGADSPRPPLARRGRRGRGGRRGDRLAGIAPAPAGAPRASGRRAVAGRARPRPGGRAGASRRARGRRRRRTPARRGGAQDARAGRGRQERRSRPRRRGRRCGRREAPRHPRRRRLGGGDRGAGPVGRRRGRCGGGGAVAAALELEQVCRELARSDPLHAFLARRTRVLDAAAAFRDGVQLNARTRLAEAKQAFQRALVADPGFWPAHLYLALNAKATGHFGEWEGELAAARSLVPHPDEGEAAVLEEVAAVLSEDSQRRLEAFERARAFFPESGELTYRAAPGVPLSGPPGGGDPAVREAAALRLAARLEPDAGRVGVLAAAGGAVGRRAGHDLGGRRALPDALQVPAVRGARPAPARPRAAGARGARAGDPQAPRLHEHEPARRASGGAVLGLTAALGRGAAPAVAGGARRGREGVAGRAGRSRSRGRARRGACRPRTVRRGERGARAAGRRRCGRPGGVPRARPSPGRVGRPGGGPRRSRARRRALAGREGPRRSGRSPTTSPPAGARWGTPGRGSSGCCGRATSTAPTVSTLRWTPTSTPCAAPECSKRCRRAAVEAGHRAQGAEETWSVVRQQHRHIDGGRARANHV